MFDLHRRLEPKLSPFGDSFGNHHRCFYKIFVSRTFGREGESPQNHFFDDVFVLRTFGGEDPNSSPFTVLDRFL